MYKHPTISLVMGSCNRLPFLKLTLRTIRKELADIPHEIIVVDGSTDGTQRWLMRQKDVITIVQHNQGTFRGKTLPRRSWGYFMNLGFKVAQGKYICMISDDCLIVPGAIANGIALFEKKQAQGEKLGALAFYYRNWPEEQDYKVQAIDQNKVCLNHGLYLRDALKEINFIDEETYQFYYADFDLCLRLMQAGYHSSDSPDSFIEHYKHADSATNRKSNIERSQDDHVAFRARWGNSTTRERTRAFTDPYRTAHLFKKVPTVRLAPLKTFFRNLLKKIR